MAVKAGKLTPKQAKFAKEYASGKSATEAAMIAYNTADRRTAKTIGSENLSKPTISEALAKAFAKSGINEQSIADVLSDAMLAKKTLAYDGEIHESTIPDHTVRVNAAARAAALMGAGQGKDGGDAKPTIQFNFQSNNYIKND